MHGTRDASRFVQETDMFTTLNTHFAALCLVLAAAALSGCDRRAGDTAATASATPGNVTTTPAPMPPASAASQ
jgi:hypothetical protein